MSSGLESRAAFEATQRGFLSRVLTRPKPLLVGIKLTSQVAIVTGSNTGLGFAASRQLLKLGLAHLVMGVRSQAKGDEAANQLRNEFPAATISVWIVDMESYDSIRAFVERCATLPRIDMAILNAGLMKFSHTTVPATGHESTLQVNYLSTALLAILLLPVLKSKKAPVANRTRPPVLSIVGSDMAYRASVNYKGGMWPQFDKSEDYEQFLWYSRSKLLLTYFFSRLAEFADPEDVVVNMPNPGYTKGTSFHRESNTLSGKLIGVITFLIARRVDIGATTYLDAALVRGKESHGSFLSEWTLKPFPPLWYTPEGREFKERLWEETIQELNFADVSKVLEDMRNRL